MAKNINYVSHKKSKLKDSNGKPQLPSASALVEGEIAINYAENVETLSIKNESGTVVTFSSDNYYTEKKLGSGFTGANSATTVTEAIVTIEEVVSASLNDLNTRKLDASAYTPTDLSNYYTKDETSGKTEISTALGTKVNSATFTAHTADTSVHFSGNEKGHLDSLATNIAAISGISSSDINSWNTVTAKTDNSTFTAHTASTVHMTTTEKTNLDSLATNIAAISGISSTKVSNWDTAYTNNHTHSNKAKLDAITGDVGTMAYQNTSSYSSATQVSTALGDKADKATTIAGYGITDAKIANQVITLGTNSVTVSSATQVNTALGAKVNSATYTGHTADTSIHFTTGAVQTQINNSISGKVDTNTFNTIVGSGYTNTTITDVIENMDEAVAAALTDLDDNKIGKTIEITWANLKSARDNSTLIPGQWYRITDYVTTTTQANTQSAGHQFDIIVRADDVNVLNENAFAAKHSGDTYFTNAGAKLEAWQLKYTLDNKYWSLAPHGEQITNYGSVYEYEGTEEINSTTYYKWYDIDYTSRKKYTLGKSVGDTVYYSYHGGSQLDESGTIGSYMPASDANGKGTIYWMKDEFNNECSYDFKNIQFKFTSAIENSGIVDNVFYYTFSRASGDNDATITDHSLVKYCIRNKVIYMEEVNDKVKLPFNVFRCNRASECFTKNIIIGNNISNTFSSAEYNEIIGVGCNNNSFGEECFLNKIHGIECSNNEFYEGCYSNSMIGESKSNILGRGSYGNKFDSVRLITLGEKCRFNSFESGCYYISLGEYCRYNTFGISCSNITFGTSESTKSYCRYIIVENGNQYIYLDCSATTSYSAYFQNVKIAQGVNNTNTYKTITHTTAGDTFQTIYKPANSVEVSV